MSLYSVTYFTRRQSAGLFSLEVVYRVIEKSLPSNLRVKWSVNRYSSKGVFRRLADAVCARRHQGDVNHVIGDVHYLTYFLRSKRTVLTIHDFVRIEQTRGLRRFVIWLFWYWLPVKRSARIVVISEATKSQLQRHVRCDPSKIWLIHNPVPDRFRPSNRSFGEGQLRILHVGTGSNKNLLRHAQALRGIKCQFVILGSLGVEQQAFLSDLKLSYEVHSGLSDGEVVLLYQSCDLLLFASTYEGFGMPIVEAQATGMPVITSKFWSMPEVAGAGAILVDPYNVGEIHTAVKRIVDDSETRERLIEHGFRNVDRFRSQKIAGQYADLYLQLTNGTTRNCFGSDDP